MPDDGRRLSFEHLLREAVRDLSEHGYQSQSQIDNWVMLLREAARRSMTPEAEIERELRREFGNKYERLIGRGKIVERVPGVPGYTLSMISHELRAELDRRIIASADLIRLNRREAVDKTIKRFSGWSTAIPEGGGLPVNKREVASDIGKSVRQVRFEARRVAIDQGHKLVANIADIVAMNSGAIAGIWHDRGEHDASYDARKVHLARSGKLFLVKDSWAIENGLIRRGSAPYIDSVERPGELPFCSCFFQYISSLRDIPAELLTEKGRQSLAAKAAA